MADFLGVILLGTDLLRLQHAIRRQSRQNLAQLNAIASEYGGVQAWSEEICKQAVWVPQHVISRHHADDELSYNVRRFPESLSEIAQCVAGLAEHVSKIMLLHDERAKIEAKAAKASLRYSIAGLAIIAFGFGLQLIGALPC